MDPHFNCGRRATAPLATASTSALKPTETLADQIVVVPAALVDTRGLQDSANEKRRTDIAVRAPLISLLVVRLPD